jgi:NADP-dependent 3-hydroxy acid dehydrogenase YdfG
MRRASGSAARRFGRAGYAVALVARNENRLKSVVDELAGRGIETVGG